MALAGAAESPSTIPVRVVDIIAKTAELNISAHGMIFGGRERCFQLGIFQLKGVCSKVCLLGGVCSRQGSAHVRVPHTCRILYSTDRGVLCASCLSPLGGVPIQSGF